MSKLKNLREKLFLTQEELSAKSGISVRTIQRIESGSEPKGYTLKKLALTLDIPETDLLESSTEVLEEKTSEHIPTENIPDFQKLKLINLSSILFVIAPPLNILAPLLISFLFKQKNVFSKQIISLQILWTILAPLIFMGGILLKLGKSFTILLLAMIILSNIYLILRNLAELDRKKQLRYKLNFNIL